MSFLLSKKSNKEGTLATYDRMWARFRQFYCQREKTSTVRFPVSAKIVGLFFTSMHDTGVGKSSIKTASAAITAEHEIRNFYSPCTSPLVTKLKQALIRDSTPKESQARRPLVEDELEALCEYCRKRSKDPRDCWSMMEALLWLSTGDGCRIGENLGLRVKDLPLDSKGSAIYLADCKTDKYSRGSTRPGLSDRRGGTIHAKAITAIRRYLGAAGLTKPSRYIFIRQVTDGYKHIDYSTVRTHLLEASKAIGLKGKIGWHSLRKQGADLVESRSGFDREKVEQFLGHAKGSKATSVYLSKGRRGDKSGTGCVQTSKDRAVRWAGIRKER
jgi:integrase